MTQAEYAALLKIASAAPYNAILWSEAYPAVLRASVLADGSN